MAFDLDARLTGISGILVTPYDAGGDIADAIGLGMWWWDERKINALLAGSGDASPAGLMFLGLGLIGLRDRIERGFRGDA